MSCNFSNFTKIQQAMKLGVKSPRLSRGFTLIELIIVIIILGILSATVLPKFFGSNGFSEYAYRSDAIAKLRLIQTKAMQQTTIRATTDPKALCSRIVLVTADKLGAPDDCDISANFAITSLSFSTAAAANSEEKRRATTVSIDDNDKSTVSFSTNATNSNFVFDSMGRPFTLNEANFPTISCSPCTITITGDEAVVIQIEQEGYIHAL